MQAHRQSQEATKCPPFQDGTKLMAEVKTMFWKRCQEDRELHTSALWLEVELQFGSINVSVRYLNLLRRRWGFQRNKGRPKKDTSLVPFTPAPPIEIAAHIPFVGVCLFQHWLHALGIFDQVALRLKEAFDVYRNAHPEDRNPLPNHRLSTFKLHFQALFFAPLFGIHKFTEYDSHTHSLPHVLGRNYQNSTLQQALCRYEKVDAGAHLMSLLMPEQPGVLAYIDGHMLGFWSSRSMHKGKITMLGRIMPGSQAVVAHNQDGQVLFFEYHPPDIRLNPIILDYCLKLKQSAGIEVFVVDREVNSLEVAEAFQEAGLGLLTMLNSNQYNGLDSFDTELLEQQKDGKVSIYRGKWKDEKKKKTDGRHFVIQEKEDSVLVYWGTDKVKEVIEEARWPDCYRERTEVQENSFKRMIAHGALRVNYGTKIIWSEDRHHGRKREEIEGKLKKKEEKIEGCERAVTEQEEKVRESKEKGHRKRLESRKKKLVRLEDKLLKEKGKKEELREHLEELGEPGQRGDRDFRKQTLLTFRTMLLENLLLGFFGPLMEGLGKGIGIETAMNLLLKRSGGFMETGTERWYWVSSEGLSVGNKRILEHLIEGLNRLQLQHQGTPVKVRIRDGTCT